ncbi:hypothetical protein [Anabaena sp. UHCC 0451]|uniref:hypothetical protein n=1 Tax=Anabaena sp. UHCC 0451 TaxID=2055235 RepID=UPI002B2183D8|nr:hypothetical protein [Anabaena sp. UHCC 0451]MEA5575118.1 hypothetical protein [Anabaena sp. UHCC 0451]
MSYATQTLKVTQAWDTFMSLVATIRKLGISFFEYIRDRISQLGIFQLNQNDIPVKIKTNNNTTT